MLQLTKIFRFEMAHAIDGYSGACRHIHGHSYELHVTVSAKNGIDGYISSPGFVMDFKHLKSLVLSHVIEKLDHRLLLSNSYINNHRGLEVDESVIRWEVEPTAENLLIYIHHSLKEVLPSNVKLAELKLNETADSYARWIDSEFLPWRPCPKIK